MLPALERRVLTALSCAALVVPVLLAFNLPPSSTFLNQAFAVIGWGGYLLLIQALPGAARLDGRRLASPLMPLLLAFGLLGVAAGTSPLWTHLPWALAVSALGLVAAGLLCAAVAAAASQRGTAHAVWRAFCIGMLVAGILSSVVGIVQVFTPALADGNVIARSYMEGRAVGNMRQPNHLSSLLLWAIVAAVWLGEARVVQRGWAVALTLLFVFVVVLSASRTGALSMAVLLAWGALDKRLSRGSRWLLIATPLVYALCWYGTGLWADFTHHVFGGETRFSTQGDISSSRWGIWSNTLALIRMHPWVGVGFGEFNFAWTLTPFPGRPVAFFDHTHNLPLQLLVELGIPLGSLVIGLLLYALWRAFEAARAPAVAGAAPGEALLRPAAFMMVLLILVHSLLEYPLWYAYFLLPAAFAFGICLGERGSGRGPGRASDAASRPRLRPLVVASLVLTFGGIASLVDYARVVVIFAPPEGAAPLAQRIVDGRRSVFFSHHADYAAATTTDHPSAVLPAFLGAPHYLLDARLLQAWATALAEAGDVGHARYVAQRLREFRNAGSAEFFAPCDSPVLTGAAIPFQCQAPTREFTFENFR